MNYVDKTNRRYHMEAIESVQRKKLGVALEDSSMEIYALAVLACQAYSYGE